VQSIVAQTMRSGDVSARTRDTLTSRILALSKAHDVLTNEQWAGADLGEIAAQAALPFRTGLGEERIAIQGPQVLLPPKTAIAVALAFHELATNAVKYGALSTPEGKVALDWQVGESKGARQLTIAWREIDGPPVSPPTRVGFGTRLIERGLAADLNGNVHLDYPREGVVCTIRASLEETDEATPTPPLRRPTAAKARRGEEFAPPP
jgi:two-component sensor histidine kinase